MVTDRCDASLRWANSSMTTNGVSTSRVISVISIVRSGENAHVGSVRTSEADPEAIASLVAASETAARQASRARDSAPLITGVEAAADWEAPVVSTGAEVFGALASALVRGFRGKD